jgi:3-deoxy-D-manno-oct-2-ulosonic acid (Kdo) hydroxylase
MTWKVISMSDIITLPNTTWDQRLSPAEQELAVDALERGNVLVFPQLSFLIQDRERQFLSPTIVGAGKNVSLDPSTWSLRGSSVREPAQQRLKMMMNRFAKSSQDLVDSVLPNYQEGLVQARTSFRPVEISGRNTSRRKDDTRLHVDSFPSWPTQGNRILRVFTNVNPNGQSRGWRLGETFEGVARRYLPSIPRPIWGASSVLNLLGITKGRRTAYDHYMLHLHDRMKADIEYQEQVTQRAYEFNTGSTWMVFTDVVSHAATGGQYAFEQTYHLPVNAMLDPSRAPVRILENLLGHDLV